jgi:hypothetical protein
MRNWNRKQASFLILVLLCVLALSDCSSWNQKNSPPPNPISQPQEGSSPPPTMSGPRPLVYDFPDVPCPSELSRQDRRTFVIQSGTMKAGLLTLRGMRVDVRSLINFFQVAMPRENWKPKGGFMTKRTVLIFEKPDKTCVINLFETTLYTYAEIYVAPASGAPL